MKNLSNLCLTGFPKLPWNSVLQSNLLQFEYHFKEYSTKEFYRQLFKIVVVSFFSREKYTYEDNKSKILFFQSPITRKNVLENLKNIRGT